MGTLRVLEIEKDSFSLGSWIVRPGSPRLTAFEALITAYEFGFYELNLSRCHFYVRRDNPSAAFHHRMGLTVNEEREGKIFFEYLKPSYAQARDQFLALIRS